jgi:hypothetical protein
MKKQILFAALFIFIASMLMTALAPAQIALAANNDVKITLKAGPKFPKAKGTAKYRNRGGERELQVEVENVKNLAGKTLNVFAKGNKVGTMKINQLGAGRLELNSTLGHTVPNMGPGSKVQVKTAQGVIVVAGTF